MDMASTPLPIMERYSKESIDTEGKMEEEYIDTKTETFL